MSTLQAAYPHIQLAAQTRAEAAHLRQSLAAMRYAGLVVGTPAAREPLNDSATGRLEQLLRGLRGRGAWAIVTVAVPLANEEALRLKRAAIQELEELADATQATGGHLRPTAEQYRRLLEAYVDKLDRGHDGLFHVSVAFLANDLTTFGMLAARLKAFNGPDALPDPLQVIPLPEPDALQGGLGIVALPGAPSGTHLAHPFHFLSLLRAEEWAAWSRLPAQESMGLPIQRHAEFGQHVAGHDPAAAEAPSLGQIKG